MITSTRRLDTRFEDALIPVWHSSIEGEFERCTDKIDGTTIPAGSSGLIQYLLLSADDGRTSRTSRDRDFATWVASLTSNAESTSTFTSELLQSASITKSLIGSCQDGVLFALFGTALSEFPPNDDYVRRLRPKVRQPRALALLQSWLTDKELSAEQDAALATVVRELDKDRLGHRVLFEAP